MLPILKNRRFEATLIIVLVAGIGIVLLSYALHVIERRFYTESVNPLQTINAAEAQYKLGYPQRGYSRTLAELSGMNCGTPTETSACLIDQALANATSADSAKSGYVYTYVAGPPNAKGVIESYSVRGDPAKKDWGTNHFYTDETGVVRIEKDKPATKESPIRKSDY